MRILILGGTTEAAILAEACAGKRGWDVLSSLAGRTSAPRALPGRVRVGGFGGADGLRGFLHDEAIERVVDATHPFARRMAANAAVACGRAGVPRLRLLRPPWPQEPLDRWHEVDDSEAGARLLPGLGRRAFLTLGATELAAFAARPGLWFLVRSIEVPAHPPLENALWIAGRGPFRLEDEMALMRAHGIEVLVSKASGGAATYAKIEAARALGLPVIMLRRPEPPPGPVAGSVAEAVTWLHQDRGAGRST